MIIYKREGKEYKTTRVTILDRKGHILKDCYSIIDEPDVIEYRVILDLNNIIIDDFWGGSGIIQNTEIIPIDNVSKVKVW